MTWTFVQDGIAVAVEAANDDLIWLREFLEPAFTIDDTGRSDVRISFEATLDCPVSEETPSHDAVIFALDSGAICLPASEIPGGIRLSDVSRGLTIDVTQANRDVRIRYHANRLTARFALMRVVREYAHNHSVHTSSLILHAAAVTVGDTAIAIAGPKGAGKTTLALRLLTLPQMNYLANDRVLVRPSLQPQAIAVPAVISLRAGTRALMPDLTDALQQCGDFREHAGERHVRGPVPPVMVGTAWNVSPFQLGMAIDRPLRASARLAAVIFPAHDRPAATQFRALTVPEATNTLKESLLCRSHGQYVSNVFVTARGGAPDESRLHSACQELASAVPCFSCAISDDEPAENVVASILTSRSGTSRPRAR